MPRQFRGKDLFSPRWPTNCRSRNEARLGAAKMFKSSYDLGCDATMRFTPIKPLLFLILFSVSCQGGDWPQILGPYRNGYANDETLAGTWDAKPPKENWKYSTGEGYAGVAVLSGRVLLFHRQDGVEILACLSANTGDILWSAEWPARYAGGFNPDQGPRCVPLVDNQRVYVHGAAGDMHCVQLQDGKKVWSKRLAKELRANDGYFGAGSTPILLDGTLMVNVGGKKAAIVGLHPASGEYRWKSVDDAASYSSPTIWAKSDGNVAIFVTRLNVVGIKPADGSVVFQVPFGKVGPTVNAATPLLVGDRLLLTASYGIGARYLDLSQPTPSPVWENDRSLSSQYPSPVFHNGSFFGVHGREDGSLASLRCVEADSGKIRWEKKGVGMAHLIVADEKLLVLQNDGQLIMIEPTSSGYRELGRARVTQDPIRALPALSQGKLFVRDTAGKLAVWELP